MGVVVSLGGDYRGCDKVRGCAGGVLKGVIVPGERQVCGWVRTKGVDGMEAFNRVVSFETVEEGVPCS